MKERQNNKSVTIALNSFTLSHINMYAQSIGIG